MAWTLQTIQQMVNGKIEESLTLDYKRAAALEKSCANEIAKDVSSFANSAGGAIIYGVAEDANNRHLPGDLNPVSRQKTSKEWIESIINSNIHPKIDGVIIHPISINNDECIYVIEIPQSPTGHQAPDRGYYKRYNFSSTPMEDYEIRDVMNRSKVPHIELGFRLKLYTPKDALGIPRFGVQPKIEDLVSLGVTAINRGVVTAHHVVAKIRVPTKIAYAQLVAQSLRDLNGPLPDQITVTLTNKTQDRSAMGNVLSDVRFEPILPQLSNYLGSCNLTDDAWITSNQDLEIMWRIHADNAPARSGATKLREMNRVDGRRQ